MKKATKTQNNIDNDLDFFINDDFSTDFDEESLFNTISIRPKEEKKPHWSDKISGLSINESDDITKHDLYKQFINLKSVKLLEYNKNENKSGLFDDLIKKIKNEIYDNNNVLFISESKESFNDILDDVLKASFEKKYSVIRLNLANELSWGSNKWGYYSIAMQNLNNFFTSASICAPNIKVILVINDFITNLSNINNHNKNLLNDTAFLLREIAKKENVQIISYTDEFTLKSYGHNFFIDEIFKSIINTKNIKNYELDLINNAIIKICNIKSNVTKKEIINFVYDHPIKVQDFLKKEFLFKQLLHSNKRNSNSKSTENIKNIYSDLFLLPAQPTLSKDDFIQKKNNIKKTLIGLDDKVELICSYIYPYFANFSSNDKVIANFLLIGSSGVGKTEIVKQVAKEFFGDKLITINISGIDLSNKMNELRFLTGIGPEFSDSMAQKIVELDEGVILFDEIEKNPDFTKHPLFTEIISSGKLTTSNNTIINLDKFVIFATSNKFNDLISNNSFSEKQTSKLFENFIGKENLYFYDKILVFRPYDIQSVEKIINLLIDNKLLNCKKKIYFEENNKQKYIYFLIKHYMENKAGIRGIKNLIEKKLDLVIEKIEKTKELNKTFIIFFEGENIFYITK
ncbi:AAA family ATPase [Mycoplasma zalophi]|uniref:AAA family ATPase n=1 Tax=Mycoplasma zalophi TaxID=191287 RepID=UPI001C112990|nr:AAA family ATPase [Mycoplasma zalophi]MBU4690923.1 AAA family ATPase [Mycoplasma zalophi]